MNAPDTGLTESFERRREMSVHYRACRFAIAIAESEEKFFMVLTCQRRPSGHGHKCQHSAAELIPEHIEQIEEETVIRGFDQQNMIFEVKRNELFGMSDSTTHLLGQILKLTEVLLRSAHRRPRRSGILQR